MKFDCIAVFALYALAPGISADTTSTQILGQMYLAPERKLAPVGYKTWMSDNISTLRTKKMTEISIPGSHDAGMFVAKDCTLAGVGGPTDCNTRTQEFDISEQLSRGARFFDLRPVYNQDATFVTGHFSDIDVLGITGCAGGGLSDILKDVSSFAAANPQELVILKLSHYYNRKEDTFGFSDVIMTQLTAVVHNNLSAHLVKSNSGTLHLLDLQYEDLLKSGNVIAAFDGVTSDWTKGLLSTNEIDIYDKYSNSNDFATMKADQYNKLSSHGGKADTLFLLSWTLTQDSTQAAGCSFDPSDTTSSIRDLSETANKQLDLVLKEKDRTGILPNIVYTDFVDGSSTWVSMQLNGITQDPGEIECGDDDECANGECGRLQAGDNGLVCCRSGTSDLYWGHSYCYDMPDGNTCWSDGMCKSGYCKGNGGGTMKGVCTQHIAEGGACPSQTNDDCAGSAGCYRTTRYGGYKCCSSQCHCDFWDPGCTSLYWYCSSSGLGC